MSNSVQTKSFRKDEKAPSFMVPLFKLPVFLYRIRRGGLLGNRFMQLTHTGRRTGKVHRTILAVLQFDPQTQEILAVSAWKGNDWYYNIEATPALLVESGRMRYVPQQRTLSAEEIATAFVEYCRRYPLFSRIICRIPGWKWNSSYEEFLELARTLRGVAFRPR